MISVVCLSPAIDVTYRVEKVALGESNRVLSVQKRPGGKGVNVARVLQSLGASPRLHIPLGGSNGAWIISELQKLGVETQFVPIAAETRSALAVVDNQVSVFNEPASQISENDLDLLEQGIASSAVIVVSGSVPKSIAPEIFREFLGSCKQKTETLIVDTSGEYLLAAAEHADYLKPNLEELVEATKLPMKEALAQISQQGTKVILSMGENGVELHGDRVLKAKAPKQTGNPTGAGDALVAGFAHKLSESEQQALEFGCALSAASVRSQVAGEFNPEDLTEIQNQMGAN